jgi:hypothetical protein
MNCNRKDTAIVKQRQNASAPAVYFKGVNYIGR